MKHIEDFLVSSRTLLIACSIVFLFGALYNIAPFFYSKDYLVKQTQKDLNEFLASKKAIEDKRFTFLKKEKNGTACAINKYVPYSICRGGKQL